MSITAEWDASQWKKFRRRVESNLSAQEQGRVLSAVAYKGLGDVVAAMPKRTGALKRSWRVTGSGNKERMIASASKVALFLEEGTKAHGPKRAKFLYIPLRPGAAVWRKGFVFGKDYVLAKRVRGIAANKYLEPVSKKIADVMVDEFEKKMAEVGRG